MTGSTITGNTSKSIERHIGSSYKTIVYVSKYLNEVKLVSDNIESGVITDIHDNLGNIALVYTNMDNIVTVSDISDDIVVVANSANEVVAVGSNIDDVTRVRQSIDDVIRVSQSADNVDRIALSIDNLDRVFASIDNIDIVVNHADDVDTVAANIAQVIATGNAIADVNTVAANIAYVLNVSNNMADVINASSFVDDIHASVAAAALSEANALASEQASAVNATQTSLDAASTSADKADVTTMRDEVEVDRGEVELNTAQVAADTLLVAADKATTEGYKTDAEAARLESQRWATGISGSGNNVPSDTNNAYYYSEIARNNANQTFKAGGYFTPTLGQEYPDVVGVEVDTIWLVKFATAGETYTFTAGDMAGQTVANGYMVVYDTPADTFDFIPTTLSGATSVNGVNPDGTGNVTITGNDISDVFTEAEVLAITDALAARVTTLETTATDHETRIVDLETQQVINTDDISTLDGRADTTDTTLSDHESRISSNETAITGLQTDKADANLVIVKSNGTTGGVDVPRWTTLTRPDTTGTDKAIFGFNTDTEEYEAYNPISDEWGSVGGGGIPLYGQEIADFTGIKKKAFEVNMLDNVNKTVTFDANFVDGDWISLSFMDWGNVAGLYALLDFTDVPMLIRGVEYTTYRVLEPCVLQLQRIAGYWKCVGISNGSGSYYALEQRVTALDEDSGWIDFTSELLNGWVSTGSEYPAQYRKIGNKVTIRGLISDSSATADIPFVLPEGFRPSQNMYKSQANNLPSNSATLIVTTAGVMRFLYYATDTGSWHSIDCSFYVD